MTPEYEYSYLKDQVCFDEKFGKPAFGPQTLIFHFHFFRMSSRGFERPAEISNVRPRFRTSDRNSECWKPGALGKWNPPSLSALLEFIPGFSRFSGFRDFPGFRGFHGKGVRCRRSDRPKLGHLKRPLGTTSWPQDPFQGGRVRSQLPWNVGSGPLGRG